jgi:hypothetical protein
MNDFNKDLKCFLEQKSLYSWSSIDLPECVTGFASLSQIEMECPQCRISRPFSDRRSRGSGRGLSPSKLESIIYTFRFDCDGCSASDYIFFVEVNIEKRQIRKVGQNPAWSINLDKNLEKFLEDDASFFKKALVCESQGYGIAAYSYYRRVLENSIGKILQNLLSVLEINGGSPEEIGEINKALSGTVMDERIRIAKDAVPRNIRPNNMNPLTIIYDILSKGIHRLPEDECLENSKNIRIALVYLIKAITQQNQEQREFLDSIKSLNEFNSRKAISKKFDEAN